MDKDTRKPKLAVIFDFDGTLADTFVLSVRIYEKITHKAEPFSTMEIERLRGMSALHLVRELRIRPWRIPWMLVRGRALMRRQLEEVKLFDGTEAVLRQLHEQGVALYVMSSNSPGNIRKVLEAGGLNKYFIRLYGNVSVFGKAKMLRKVLARNRLDQAQVIYVGDEGRDIEAAKRVGVKCVAVGWGFNSSELLAKHHPDALVQMPDELVAYILKHAASQHGV